MEYVHLKYIVMQQSELLQNDMNFVLFNSIARDSAPLSYGWFLSYIIFERRILSLVWLLLPVLEDVHTWV